MLCLIVAIILALWVLWAHCPRRREPFRVPTSFGQVLAQGLGKLMKEVGDVTQRSVDALKKAIKPAGDLANPNFQQWSKFHQDVGRIVGKNIRNMRKKPTGVEKELDDVLVKLKPELSKLPDLKKNGMPAKSVEDLRKAADPDLTNPQVQKKIDDMMGELGLEFTGAPKSFWSKYKWVIGSVTVTGAITGSVAAFFVGLEIKALVEEGSSDSSDSSGGSDSSDSSGSGDSGAGQVPPALIWVGIGGAAIMCVSCVLVAVALVMMQKKNGAS